MKKLFAFSLMMVAISCQAMQRSNSKAVAPFVPAANKLMVPKKNQKALIITAATASLMALAQPPLSSSPNKEDVYSFLLPN